MSQEVVEHHTDAVGLRVVLVDKIAHARGEVEARPVVGDLAIAPRAVYIYEQENIRRAVADVLVVDPFGLLGLGLNRDPRFPDQLPGRFIETDHRSPRVRRLGVQIEYVFHARHVLSGHRWNVPHLLPPRLQLHLCQSAPHRATRHGLVRGEADEFARQQIQRPISSLPFTHRLFAHVATESFEKVHDRHRVDCLYCFIRACSDHNEQLAGARIVRR